MATSFASPPPRISPERPPATSPRAARYTIDGSDALEERLHATCESIREKLLEKLPRGSVEGLLLGGGYGRGEGGVLTTADGDQPYNDLEFYLFARGNRHLFEFHHRTMLEQLSHDLSPGAGLEVEIKILSLEELRRAPLSMFFYDMIAGHKWLVGTDDSLRGCEHHRAAHLLEVSEATRLLMNRCTGLLFAREHLSVPSFEEANADFVRRNIRKAQLAFGDAILTAFGRYHWSCRKRHERLKNLRSPIPWLSKLVEHHALGVDFKLHPFKSEEEREDLSLELERIVAFAGELWLWLESKRLGQSFISARHYATHSRSKWPGPNPARNVLQHAKLFRRPVVRGAWRHPRERVLETLALLLWEPLALADSRLRGLLQRNLRARIGDRATAVRCYARVWSQVS